MGLHHTKKQSVHHKIIHHRRHRTRFSFWLIIVVSIVAVIGLASALSADTATIEQSLKGSKLSVEIDDDSQKQAIFPNGRECFNVTVMALNSEKLPLLNQPLAFVKSSKISIVGASSTGATGISEFCLTASQPVSGKVSVKLTSYPSISKSFSVNFKPKVTFKDITDRKNFVINSPATFAVEVKPDGIESHFKVAQLKYAYSRRYNQYLTWKYRHEVVTQNLTCHSGYCESTISGTNVVDNRTNGKFTYTFYFVDESGRTYQKTYRGTLKKERTTSPSDPKINIKINSPSQDDYIRY